MPHSLLVNGALLYHRHLCQKGRETIVEGDLYPGTSKSAEVYAARVTFQRAKEEGMDVTIHWQDADFSSTKAVREIYPNADIMICGEHAGRAHNIFFGKNLSRLKVSHNTRLRSTRTLL